MIQFSSIAELVALADARKTSISHIILEWESQTSECSTQFVREKMNERLIVMREAVRQGLEEPAKSFSGLVGEDAQLLANSASFFGPVAMKTAAFAMAVSEVNASMGKIVACPTAGSCGIVPGALLAVAECCECNDDQLVNALLTSAGIGEVIASNATVSGAVGGCQAECGSAAAMAAASVVEMLGGTPQQAAEAVALALKNLLGLACDPVAGLVEVPCVKRNAFAAVHSLVAAQMALVGIKSAIPADEVVAAMYRIGLQMPCSLKETSTGGLAVTPTAQAITERLKEN